MGKIKETISAFRNDGSDPRKNDAWRILLFALNNSGGLSIMHLMGKWSYYTQNVLQLGVFLSSIVMFMTLLDAVTDPLIANWFDRFESKHGKLRPFMLMGCIMSFVPAVVIFCYPVNAKIPLWATYAILTLMYAIIVVGNTITMTATRAGQAIITQDPGQRPLYALGQTVFDAIVMAFVSLVVTGDIIGKMQDALVWRVSIMVLSVVSVILVLIAMQAIKNRDNKTYYSVSEKHEKVKITEFLKLVKRSKPMRSLIAATASDALAAGVRATLAIYLFANIIMQRSLSATFEIVSGVLLGAPILLIGIYFASKKGSAVVYSKISIVQTLLALSGFFICIFFLPADPAREYSGLTFGVLATLLIFGIYMSTLGISSNLVNAMTGDLADYEFYQSGKFIPGTIGATLTFCNKIVSSCVGLVVTGIMLFCGFKGSGEVAVVPENVFVNYRFYYCVAVSVFILPAIGHFITYIAMRKYPLDAKTMNEVSLYIAEKRGVLSKEKAKED